LSDPSTAIMVGGWIIPLVYFSLLFSVQVCSLPSNICVIWDSNDGGDCFGGDDALTTTDVNLSYNFTSVVLHIRNVSQKVYALEQCQNCTQAEYVFNQPEHGGGECNCVEIYFGDTCNSSHSRYLFTCAPS